MGYCFRRFQGHFWLEPMQQIRAEFGVNSAGRLPPQQAAANQCFVFPSFENRRRAVPCGEVAKSRNPARVETFQMIPKNVLESVSGSRSNQACFVWPLAEPG